MKPSDFTNIYNGLEAVARAFIKIHSKELDKFWKNSSLNTISKSLASSAEETISSVIASSGKQNPALYIAKEVKERSAVVTESIKQYSVYAWNQKKESKLPDLDIDHPVIHQGDQNLTSDYKKIDDIQSTPKIQFSDLNPVKVEQQIDVSIPIKQISQLTPSTLETKPPDAFSETVQPTTEFVKSDRRTKPSKSHKIQSLSDRAREREVPATKVRRIASYTGLAAGMVMGAAAEMARRGLGLKSSKDSTQALLSENPFLSEANANRIVETLCKVRGAALKLGQMLSIQDNAMINPQLAAVFERVRQSADFMPRWQMEKVLTDELGPEWRSMLSEFDSKPFAAASIGQVHCAKLLDGTDVALKIQYPGVAKGIESDIKSLMTIVNLLEILPKGLYVENVMAVAERELKKEVDYLHEAQSAKQFKKLLESYPQYAVPEIYDNLCTKNILTSELVYGTPIDKLQDASQDLRNEVCENLLQLCLMEVFLFRFMQTDPNWANFLYNYDTKQIILLDFGACNEYTPTFVDTYMKIIKSAAEQDRASVLRFSQDLGFLTGYETKAMEEAHVDAVMILGEAFACKEPFNFRQQNMTRRIHDLVPIMLKHRLTPPPDETYSLHRKMSGIFLLCTKLGAVVDCSKLFNNVYNEYCSRKSQM